MMQDPNNGKNMQPNLSDEEITKAWRNLWFSLIEFKEMAKRLSEQALLMKNYLDQFFVSDESGLDDVEKDFLKEMFVYFHNISGCDPFPEIDFDRDDKVDPEKVCSTFEKLEKKVSHHSLNFIFVGCASITLNFEKLRSISEKIFSKMVLIGLDTISFVHYLGRLPLFSDGWLKNFQFLHLSNISVDNLNRIFEGINYTLKIIYEFKEYSYMFRAHPYDWPKFFAGLNMLDSITLNLSYLNQKVWDIFCKELAISNIVQLTADCNLDETRANQLKEVLIQNQSRMDMESSSSLKNMAVRVAAPFCASENIQKKLHNEIKEMIEEAKITSACLRISGGSKTFFFGSSMVFSESINRNITELQNAIDKYFTEDEDYFVVSVVLAQGQMQITFNAQAAVECFSQICWEKFKYNLNLSEKRIIKLDHSEEIEFFIEKICHISLNDDHLKCLGFETKLTCSI